MDFSQAGNRGSSGRGDDCVPIDNQSALVSPAPEHNDGVYDHAAALETDDKNSLHRELLAEHSQATITGEVENSFIDEDSRQEQETVLAAAAAAAAQRDADGNEGYIDDFAWDAPKHVFVLSSAGKPVFSLSGDEQQLSTLMGLIQGLLALCVDCGDEMESISAGNRRFVFLRRGDLVLVAISCSVTTRPAASAPAESFDRGDDGGRARCQEGTGKEPETFLRLQLEYMYSSVLFLLTGKVQTVFRRSPGYDLRGLLGGADSSLKGVIELAEPSRGRGRMLAGGVETVWMDPAVRARVTSALQAVQAAAAQSALYAIWLCGEELVALAQPRAPSHRLHSQDLLLLVNFVATQPALRNAESWTPVCFPRFQDQGYLYAYIAFLDDPDDGADGVDMGNDEIPRTGDSCLILVSTEASAEQFQAFRRSRVVLESRFRLVLGLNWSHFLGDRARTERIGILTKFCTQMHALHFYYSLRGRRGGAPCVNQVLSSPFVEALVDDHISQRRIWGHYTRAALRLRRGSSQEGRVFCRDEDGIMSKACSSGEPISGGEEAAAHRGVSTFEATAIFEADPVHSLTYEMAATETVISLFGQRDDGSSGGRWSSSGGSWGERDELHVCFSSSVPAEQAYKTAVRLAAIIRRDKEWLFLTGTGAAK